MSAISSRRADFFRRIADSVPRLDGSIIFLTHLLPDRLELVPAMARVASIAKIIAVPYSIDHPTLGSLRSSYDVATPQLAELLDPEYVLGLIRRIGMRTPFVIVEVGGYFAKALNTLKAEYDDGFMGVIEDTESGHRRYLAAQPLPCPVLSVARSNLKRPEDALVGASCLHSVEKILREYGLPFGPEPALVVGYGPVGAGVASALRQRGCFVSVYDVDPLRRVLALSHGFPIPERKIALSAARMIFGATGDFSIAGEDFELLQNGTVLASCSSKELEFDVEHLRQTHIEEPILPGFSAYRRHGRTLYLISDGQPVNFRDSAVLGPALALVQAGILVSLKHLPALIGRPGIYELDLETQSSLTRQWINHFCDQNEGIYLNT